MAYCLVIICVCVCVYVTVYCYVSAYCIVRLLCCAAMTGRKRKGPSVPEKIMKYFQRMKDADRDGNSVEMECDNLAPKKEAGHCLGLQFNLDSHDCNDLNQSQAESHCEPECSGGSVIDLGCIIKPSMTAKEICDAVDKMDNGQKYKLLMEYFKPDVSSKLLTVDVTDHFSTDGLKNIPGYCIVNVWMEVLCIIRKKSRKAWCACK